MAMTEMLGKRRRTTERNSKPDICGMLRSERTMAGSLRFNCKRASKPLMARVTSYPDDWSNMARESRTAASSSTIKISCFEGCVMGETSHFYFLFFQIEILTPAALVVCPKQDIPGSPAMPRIRTGGWCTTTTWCAVLNSRRRVVSIVENDVQQGAVNAQ